MSNMLAMIMIIIVWLYYLYVPQLRRISGFQKLTKGTESGLETICRAIVTICPSDPISL